MHGGHHAPAAGVGEEVVYLRPAQAGRAEPRRGGAARGREAAIREQPGDRGARGGAPADRRLDRPRGGRAPRPGGGGEGVGAAGGQGLPRPQGAQDPSARAHEQHAAASRGPGAALEDPAEPGGPAQVAEQPGPTAGEDFKADPGEGAVLNFN